MLCEFIGLPGTGKTTVALELYKKLNKINKNTAIYPLYSLYKKKWILRNFYKAIYVIKYSIFNPYVFKNVLSIIKKSKQLQFMDNITLSFNFLFYLSVRERYEDVDKVIIFDEGLVHHIWAICINSTCQFPFMLFKNVIKPADITIKIDCPIEIVKNRLESRNNKNKRHTGFIRNLEKIENVMNETINYFDKQKYFSNYINIKNDSENDIDINCKTILEKIQKM